MEDKERMPKVKVGPSKGKISTEKAKDLKGAITRLIKYIAKQKVVIAFVIISIIVATIFTILAPKILGNATTEIGNGIMKIMAYDEITKSLDKMPEEIKNTLPAEYTVQELIEFGIVPKEIEEKLNPAIKGMSLNEKPAMDYKAIGKILLTVLITYALSSLFHFIANRTMAKVAQNTVYGLRKDVDEKLEKLPLSFFDKHTHGEILSRVTNDIDNLSTMLQESSVQLIQAVCTMIGILVMMLSISLKMTCISILVVPTSAIVIGLIVRKSQKYFIQNQEILGQLNGHIEETFSGDTVVKAFNMQDREKEKFEVINESLYKANWKSQFLSSVMMPIMQTISNFGYVGICIVGAKEVMKGTVNLGDIQAFIQYTRQFTQPISQTAQIANMIQGAAASAERVFELLDEKEQEPERKKLTTFDGPVNGEVEFRNVSFSYKKTEPLIENFSLKAKKGETVAIVGPTGAGKTTIVNLLMRFYELDAGEILVDGKDIRSISRHDVRKEFGMVLQDTWLFGGTIKENLKYGSNNVTDEQIISAAKLAHAHHFIAALPDGYNFVINEDASNISSGQKQLLTIARAILANLPILILDEATSNVDTRTEQIIQSAMNKLMEGRTSFVIAHRLSTIKNADQIIVMKSGNIIEKGNHEKLIEKKGAYYELYNSQFEKTSEA
ncbi:MAG: ABC transporter ATP-binding protein [Clostridia bacterium]